jgi:uncharacterized ParB-like nuclease family protein
MLRYAKLHSNTNGNSLTVRKVLYYYEFAYVNCHRNAVFERLASQQENLYKNRCCDIYKENVQMNLFIYK